MKEQIVINMKKFFNKHTIPYYLLGMVIIILAIISYKLAVLNKEYRVDLNKFEEENELYKAEYEISTNQAQLFYEKMESSNIEPFINKTMKDWNTIFNSKDKSIILLYKKDCSYCTMFKPILAYIAYVYKLKIYQINVVNQDMSVIATLDSGLSQWGTPTVLITQNGKLVDYNIGYIDMNTTLQFLYQNEIITE